MNYNLKPGCSDTGCFDNGVRARPVSLRRCEEGVSLIYVETGLEKKS